MLRFLTITWRDDKAKLNLRSHKVSFSEAQTVFNDVLSSTVPDIKHPHGEPRYNTIGTSRKNRLIRVTHTMDDIHEHDVTEFRIISAREPETWEREEYEEGL